MEQLNDEERRRCVEVANAMADDYALFTFSQDPRKSLDDLLSHFSDFLGREVVFEEIRIGNPSYTPRAATLPYDGEDGKTAYRIGILPEADENMRRLVIVK